MELAIPGSAVECFTTEPNPLGQLARKALNPLPKIDTKRYSVWSNQITALISNCFHWSSCSSENEDETNEMIVVVQR